MRDWVDVVNDPNPSHAAHETRRALLAASVREWGDSVEALANCVRRGHAFLAQLSPLTLACYDESVWRRQIEDDRKRL